MDRDCETCIHHTDSGCSSWDCVYVNREEALAALRALLRALENAKH